MSNQAKIIALVSVLMLAGMIAIATAVSYAQNAPTVERNEALVDFPQEVTFRLTVDDAATITQAVLTYDVNKFSCLDATTNVPVEVNGNEIEWTWVMVRSGNPPPGASMWWEWTLIDAGGNRFTTPRQELTFTDERFDWRTLEAENIQLHWYEGDEVGPLLLEAAVAGLERLQNDMGIVLNNEAQLFIYGDTDDMRDAVLYIQEWAGGVAFSEYNIILMGVPPGIAQSWGQPTIRHELAHLVIGQFGRSCVGGSRPTWLEEGLAVYAEGEPSQRVVNDLNEALEKNSFEPVRSLNGAFPAHGPEAGIAYSQSYSVVKFLLETYGQEKMQQLILVLAEGAGYDEALAQVYGFNVDGLELEWRDALGAPMRVIPPTPTALSAANVPTIEPQGAPGDVPTPPAAAETAVPPATSTSNGSGICNLIVLPFLFIGIILTRRQLYSWLRPVS